MSESNYTILVIDYEPRSIQAAKDALEGAGYKVVVATDGLQGLSAFEQMKPGLVLIEAMIPKKHGFEVCQEIKKTPNGKTTPVVITTAVYRGRKYRTQALHIYGCDDYLEKPYPDDVLLKVCERFIGSPSAAESKEDESMAAPMAASGGGAAVSLPPMPPPEPAPEAVASAVPDTSIAPEPVPPVVPASGVDGDGAPSLNDEISDRVDALLGGGLFDSPAQEEPKPEPAAEPEAAEPAEDEVDNVLPFESPANDAEDEAAETAEAAEVAEAADADADPDDPMVETVEIAQEDDVEETDHGAPEAVAAAEAPGSEPESELESEAFEDQSFDADELPETASTLMLEKSQGLPMIAKVLVGVALLAAASAIVWMVWFQ